MRDDDENDDGDDDDGYPAYSHQSYSHQVGICHYAEGWEYDTVNFPPYLYNDKGVRGVVRLDKWNPYDTHQTSSRHLPNNLQTPLGYSFLLNKPLCPI